MEITKKRLKILKELEELDENLDRIFYPWRLKKKKEHTK